jgi:DNA-binding transcriptional ArsR family regulator
MAPRPDSQLHKLFRALAADTRVRIVSLLGERAICVGALSRILGVSSGAVSQHLRILSDAGLVEADRRGYFVHYRVSAAAQDRVRRALEALFGKGAAKMRAASMKGAKTCAAKRKSARSRKT